MGDFGKLNFSVSFNRTSAFPLEANSYFTDLEQAEAAAKTAVEPGSADSTYYIGLTLTVADETDCNLYIIKPDLSLKRLTILDTSDVAWESILNKPTTIGGYGITDAYTKTESDNKFVDVSGDTITGDLNILNLEISHNNEINSSDKVCIAYRDTPDGLNVCYNNSPFTYGKNGYKVWHAGNMGSDSGLNADLLDGREYNQFIYNHSQNYGSSDDIRNISPWTYFSGNNMINAPVPTWFSGIVMAANANQDYKAILGFDQNGDFYTGGNNNDTWRAWQQVAYTTSNVASATKLQTPRTIWGQSFDGTQNIVNSARMRYIEFSAMSGTRAGYVGRGSDDNDNIYLVSDLNKDIILLTKGKVGIGTNSPSAYLDVNGQITAQGRLESRGQNSVGDYPNVLFHMPNVNYGQILFNNINGFEFRHGDSQESNFESIACGNILVNGNMIVTGKVSAASGFYEESDVQLKTNIQPIDFTNNIELVSFNWKKDGSKSYGVIAQQVELYYPELVSTDESTGYKSVNYDAVLIIKCALLENRIKQLEKELEDLKNE